MRKSGKVLTYIFTRTISLVEKIIDDESVMSHEQIGTQINQFLNDKEALKHYQVNNVLYTPITLVLDRKRYD